MFWQRRVEHSREGDNEGDIVDETGLCQFSNGFLVLGLRIYGLGMCSQSTVERTYDIA